jgi:energy-coupling factor transporter ATP-binding protein EcfA2
LIEKQLSEPEIEWKTLSALEQAVFHNDPVQWLKTLQKEKKALQEERKVLQEEKNLQLRLDVALQEKKTLIIQKKQAAQSQLMTSPSKKTKKDVKKLLTTSEPYHSSVTLPIDGISLTTEHLKRTALVKDLDKMLSTNPITLLSSPAGSGKSSLFQLYKALATHSHFIGISCLQDSSLFELFLEIGIDFERQKIADQYDGLRVVIFLDDAQAKYGELVFWGLLDNAKLLWMPENIRFLISATHLLSSGIASPIEFQSLPKLLREDFLLSRDECFQFLDLPHIGLPHKMTWCHTLKNALVNQSGGLIAVLRLSVQFLKKEFGKTTHPTETALVLCCFSSRFVEHMARCFGSGHSKPMGNEFKYFLKRCFVDKSMELTSKAVEQDPDSFYSLQKAGILVKFPNSTFGYSSLLAKRYYFEKIFPDRSDSPPSSLPELIQNVISTMSSSTLKNSTLPGKFPKEAVFKHLFMDGLELYTPPSCCICPDLSIIFPKDPMETTQQSIPGEIDFLLTGSLRWGVALLVNGDKVGDHIDRFNPGGEYFSLSLKDFVLEIPAKRTRYSDLSEEFLV